MMRRFLTLILFGCLVVLAWYWWQDHIHPVTSEGQETKVAEDKHIKEPAPSFNQSARCAAEEQTIIDVVGDMIRKQYASPDTVYSYIDAHTSQSCKNEKAAYVAAWMKWYNAATPEQRDAQADKVGRACSSAWPIACEHGF
jgi:hypothetical protein